MVQTRRNIEGPQVSHSQPNLGGDGNLPVPPWETKVVQQNAQQRGPVDSNYNDNITTADGSDDELTRLKTDNQALQLMLERHMKKSGLMEVNNDTAASSTKQNPPETRNVNDPTEGWASEKGKAIDVTTP